MPVRRAIVAADRAAAIGGAIHDTARDQQTSCYDDEQNGKPPCNRPILTRSQAVLDRLYAEFNYPDSATDPIQIVGGSTRSDDREVVGFCAAALAFGRVASVLQSIERLLAIMGAEAGRVRAPFDPRRTAPAFADLVPPLDARRRPRGAAVDPAADVRSGGIDRRVLRRGLRPRQPRDVGPALDSFSTRALALDLTSRVRPRRQSGARRLLFLSAALGRQRLQAAEPVPALDGAPRRARPRRLVAVSRVSARRSARHARHPRRPLPAA